MLQKVWKLIIINQIHVKVCIPAGLRKKVEALAKQKQCEVVAKWQKSIINHLYWCLASITDGDGGTIKTKWLSLDNHIHNKHTSHGSQLFPKCIHRRLCGCERKRNGLIDVSAPSSQSNRSLFSLSHTHYIISYTRFLYRILYLHIHVQIQKVVTS